MENKQTKPKLKWIMGLGLALCLMAVGGAIAFNKWNESASAKFDDYTQELFQEDVVQNTINLHYTLANPENYGITDYEAVSYTHLTLPTKLEV